MSLAESDYGFDTPQGRTGAPLVGPRTGWLGEILRCAQGDGNGEATAKANDPAEAGRYRRKDLVAGEASAGRFFGVTVRRWQSHRTPKVLGGTTVTVSATVAQLKLAAPHQILIGG